MTNYYYARKAETRLNPETGKEELFLKVPVRINPETADENRQKVCMVRIGRREYPCAFLWIPESYYLQYKRMLEQEAKSEERSGRCLIPDNHGGRIVCPECNRCIICNRFNDEKFDNGHNTSLDKLLEGGYDPETGAETGSDFDYEDRYCSAEDKILTQEEFLSIDELSKQIIHLLTVRNPKYGLIFRQMLKGVTKPSDIARNTGLKANRTCEDIHKVRKLAAQFYYELREA